MSQSNVPIPEGSASSRIATPVGIERPTRRKFDRQFKLDTVRLVTKERYAVAKACKTVAVDRPTVMRWLRELAPDFVPPESLLDQRDRTDPTDLTYRQRRETVRAFGQWLQEDRWDCDLTLVMPEFVETPEDADALARRFFYRVDKMGITGAERRPERLPSSNRLNAVLLPENKAYAEVFGERVTRNTRRHFHGVVQAPASYEIRPFVDGAFNLKFVSLLDREWFYVCRTQWLAPHRECRRDPTDWKGGSIMVRSMRDPDLRKKWGAYCTKLAAQPGVIENPILSYWFHASC